MIGECFEGLPFVNIPEYASGITRGSNNVLFTDESAAAEVSIVSYKFLRCLGIGGGLTCIVDRANIIKTTAGNEVALGGFKRTGHHPRRTKGDGLQFIRRNGIPDDEFSVLGGRDERFGISLPIHGVDLAKVAF